MRGLCLALLLAQQVATGGSPPATPDVRPAGGREYRIGAGDILRVTVYGYEDLTQTVVVQPSGAFAFPLIGQVAVAESTPTEVEGRLAARLAKGLIRDPKVTVVVQEYRSKVVYVVGEVTRPGTYPLAGETTVVEMLSRSGPLSPNAGGDLLIVRPAIAVAGPTLPADALSAPSGTGDVQRAEVIRLDLRDLQEGQLQTNVVLKPNDTIFVPQAAKIFVSGEVRNPGAFPFSRGLTVRQAVSLAGGFTPEASSGGARVVRQTGGRTETIKMKLDEPVQPGDTVVVKTRLF